MSVVLHALVTLLLFVLLRRWGSDAWTAAAIAIVAAVHPSRVESVAWISGSPDLLLALFLLGSLGLTLEALRRRDQRPASMRSSQHRCPHWLDRRCRGCRWRI